MKRLTAIFVCASFGAFTSAKDLEPGSSVRGRVEAVTKDGVLLANATLSEPVTKKWDVGEGHVVEQKILDVKPLPQCVFIYGEFQAKAGDRFSGSVTCAHEYRYTPENGDARMVRGFKATVVAK